MPVAKQNTVVTTDVNITAREVDFVSQFSTDLTALMNILSIARGIKKEAGANLVMKKVSVELENSVAEGEVIPYSEASFEEVTADPITLNKYQLGVTMEMINKYGYDTAVDKVDQAMLAQIRSGITSSLYTSLEAGTLTETAKGFQKKMAKAKAEVLKHFEQLGLGVTGTVALVNTDDLYDYLGDKDITVQTAFGLNYIQNFLGFDVVIVSSYITEGTVVATALNNLNLYYIDPSDSDFAKAGLVFTTDETGFIGVHIDGNYTTAVSETTAVYGLKLYPEYADGIAVVTETP